MTSQLLPAVHRLHNATLRRAGRLRNAAPADRGGVMAEYGLLIALVAIAAFSLLGLFGETILDMFRSVDDQYPDNPVNNGGTTGGTTGTTGA